MRYSFVLLSFIFVFLLGCANDYNFKEDKEPSLISLNFESSCLEGLSEFGEDFLNAKATDLQIDQNFNCLSEAIDYIQIRVKPRVQERYSVKEVTYFLNKFLFTEPVDVETMSSFLSLKSNLIGGSAEEISFHELKVLKSFLIKAQVLAKDIKADAAALFFSKDVDSLGELDRALLQLKSYILDLMTYSSNNIDLTHIEKLWEDLSDPGDSLNTSLWNGALNLLIGRSFENKLILNENKQTYTNRIFKYYKNFVGLSFAFSKDWETERSNFSLLGASVDELFVLLRESINYRPSLEFERSSLIKLMDFVDEFEVFEVSLSLPVKEHLVEVVFSKLFPSKQEGFGEMGLNHLLNAWVQMKTFVKRSLRFEGHQGPQFPMEFLGIDLFSQFSRLRWPSLVNEDRIIKIDTRAHDSNFSFQALFHAGWQFVLSDVVVKRYSTESKKRGLLIEDVESAYADVFVFLEAIEFLGEESRGSWFRIFNEGNLLVPSATPDAWASVSEVAEYFAFMFSAYFRGQKLFDDLSEGCPKGGEVCSFNLVKADASRYFPDMPGLWTYFDEELSEKSYQIWQKSFEYIAKFENNDADYTASNWFKGSVGNQYVEVLYRKYDEDQSSTLSFQETEEAFEDFQVALRLLPQIKGTAAETNSSILKAFFTFFVRRGRLPKIENGRPKKEFFRYYLKCGLKFGKSCNYESDRSSVMAILAYLTSI